jgi:hypothetical protein
MAFCVIAHDAQIKAKIDNNKCSLISAQQNIDWLELEDLGHARWHCWLIPL